jgi:hypothetical protein
MRLLMVTAPILSGFTAIVRPFVLGDHFGCAKRQSKFNPVISLRTGKALEIEIRRCSLPAPTPE